MVRGFVRQNEVFSSGLLPLDGGRLVFTVLDVDKAQKKRPLKKLVHQMRDFRQKEKKKLPQNKPSCDEPCLPRCNTSSMVGSADPRNMAALTQFISSAMRTFWPWLRCVFFFNSLSREN